MRINSTEEDNSWRFSSTCRIKLESNSILDIMVWLQSFFLCLFTYVLLHKYFAVVIFLSQSLEMGHSHCPSLEPYFIIYLKSLLCASSINWFLPFSLSIFFSGHSQWCLRVTPNSMLWDYSSQTWRNQSYKISVMELWSRLCKANIQSAVLALASEIIHFIFIIY